MFFVNAVLNIVIGYSNDALVAVVYFWVHIVTISAANMYG